MYNPTVDLQPEIINTPSLTQEILIQCIQLCSLTYDYSNPEKCIEEKRDRLLALDKLNSFFNDSIGVDLIVSHHDLVFEMVKKNIFRSFPALADSISPQEPGVDLDFLLMNNVWPHLEGVYKIFLNLITCEAVSQKIIRIHFQSSSIYELIQLFNSDFNEERESLKFIVIALYTKVIKRRKMIRNAIHNTLLQIINDSEKFNGVDRLLEILACIIKGFNVPLREEHVKSFYRIFIPLHKVPNLLMFFEHLLICCVQFIDKDRTLAIPLVEGLLRYWPYGNSPKEYQFISELTQVLGFCMVPQFKQTVSRLFKRFIRCMFSLNQMLLGFTLNLMEQKCFIDLLKYFTIETFEFIVPAIVKLAEIHPHDEIVESLKIEIKKIDEERFDRAMLGLRCTAIISSENIMHNMPRRYWAESHRKEFTKKAMEIDKNFVQMEVPYSDRHVIDFTRYSEKVEH
jgi:serine/threonine-protein phosphatase 2A regulatory subunit B'